jgi:nitrate reductase alpha subunit
VKGQRSNGNAEIVLNFITPHQKWGIHSTYTDNLLMLTLNPAAGRSMWLSEDRRESGWPSRITTGSSCSMPMAR